MSTIGLAYEVLLEAVERGDMPTIKEMIEGGDYNLRMWETDLSSQTGASQAGILHGNNEGIVAFRWIEKGNGNQMMQCSGITKVPELEERISNGDGLNWKRGFQMEMDCLWIMEQADPIYSQAIPTM